MGAHAAREKPGTSLINLQVEQRDDQVVAASRQQQQPRDRPAARRASRAPSRRARRREGAAGREAAHQRQARAVRRHDRTTPARSRAATVIEPRGQVVERRLGDEIVGSAGRGGRCSGLISVRSKTFGGRAIRQSGLEYWRSEFGCRSDPEEVSQLLRRPL